MLGGCLPYSACLVSHTKSLPLLALQTNTSNASDYNESERFCVSHLRVVDKIFQVLYKIFQVLFKDGLIILETLSTYEMLL